jgi:predicted PurR-regulated permease PerM
LALFPQERRNRLDVFFNRIAREVGGYVRGQSIVAGAIALLTWLGLKLIGVPYAEVLGLLAFLLDFIPVVGSLLAAVFAVLIALSNSPMDALWTVVLYIAANQLEANFLGPLVIGQAVGVTPLWIILAILTGGALAGVPGVFLAIPSIVIIKAAVEEFYIKTRLARLKKTVDQSAAVHISVPDKPIQP